MPSFAFRVVLAIALVIGSAATIAAKDPEPKSDASKLLRQFYLAPDETKRQEIIQKAAALPAMPYKDFKALEDELRKLSLKPLPGPGGTRTFTSPEGHTFKYSIQGNSKSKPSPLLIYLHGSGGPDGQGGFWSHAGFVQVCPEAPAIKAAGEREWTNGYSDDFFFELLRTVRRENVIDCNRLYLAGFSAGGFGTWYYSLRFPHLFAANFPMAGGPWHPDEPEFPMESNFLNLKFLPISIWHGALDKNVAVGAERKAVAVLKKLGYDPFYKEYPDGDHGNWFHSDSGFIKKETHTWLDQKVRNPHPKEVTYFSQLVISKVHKPVPEGAYWVGVVGPAVGSDEYMSGWYRSKISGKILDGNKVEVTTSGKPKGAYIHLCQQLVDLNQPVEVKWNGKVVFNGVPQCRLDTLLATFGRAWDRDMMYPVHIDLKNASTATK